VPPGRWLRLGLLGLLGSGCVDKAPPPLWPAPPPPSVATPILAETQEPAPPPVTGVVGAPALAGPSPLDVVPPDASILDPEGPAAAAVPKPGRPPSRPAPGHK